jgi:hypothetical protein
MFATSRSQLANFLCIALAAQIMTFSPARSQAPCGVPQAGGDWPVASQAEAGLDSKRLCDLVAVANISPPSWIAPGAT